MLVISGHNKWVYREEADRILAAIFGEVEK